MDNVVSSYFEAGFSTLLAPLMVKLDEVIDKKGASILGWSFAVFRGSIYITWLFTLSPHVLFFESIPDLRFRSPPDFFFCHSRNAFLTIHPPRAGSDEIYIGSRERTRRLSYEDS